MRKLLSVVAGILIVATSAVANSWEGWVDYNGYRVGYARNITIGDRLVGAYMTAYLPPPGHAGMYGIFNIPRTPSFTPAFTYAGQGMLNWTSLSYEIFFTEAFVSATVYPNSNGTRAVMFMRWNNDPIQHILWLVQND
jgi:hypothetical protein